MQYREYLLVSNQFFVIKLMRPNYSNHLNYKDRTFNILFYDAGSGRSMPPCLKYLMGNNLCNETE